MSLADDFAEAEGRLVVTMSVAGLDVAVPIERVADVFALPPVTRVPLAPREVAGLVNLRGKVVTAICLRRKLGLPEGQPAEKPMAVGVTHRGDAFGLVVDRVGDVMRLPPDSGEACPVEAVADWSRHVRLVHRRQTGLLVEVDVDAVLGLDRSVPSSSIRGE